MMRRVHRRCLALLLLTGLASAVRAQAPDQFLGRSLPQWVADLKDEQPRVRRSAAFVLGKVGSPQAQAALLDALKDRDASVREAAAFALGEIRPRPPEAVAATLPGLFEALRDADPRVRRSAACSLGKSGSLAAGAAPQLREALRDPAATVRQNAAWALGQFGEDAGREAVDDLARLLGGDPDPLVRRDAAQALGKMGRDARPALPLLLGRFKSDEDAVVRKTALDAVVGVVTPDDTAVLDDLRAALKDRDADVARSAAFALANIGGDGAADALPVLGRALEDGDVPTRRLAATALANVAHHTPAALPDLTTALQDPDAVVRRCAALGLGNLGPRGRSAVPALIKALRPAEDEEVRKFAAEALGNIDPNDSAVIAALLPLLEEKEHYRLRQRIVWYLEHLEDFEQPGVVAGLTRVLAERAPAARLLRYEAAKVLALKLRKRVPDEAFDVLLEALRDNTIKIYRGTGAKVSGSGTEARSGQAEVREAGAGDWRTIVAIAFVRIGDRSKRPEVLDGLKKLAQDSFDPETRRVARKALEVLQPE
jgi:HEAT repeat protein